MNGDSMSSKNEPTGLLRRMFKRVSNPKYADEESHGSDSLSSEKKTQMLIRKQRNDLERKKEFAELRELHAQRLLKESGSELQLTGSDMSKTSTRQTETLNKINQLESQMASRWSLPQEAQTQRFDESSRDEPAEEGAGVQIPQIDGSANLSAGSADDLSELADPTLEEIGVLFASNEDEQVEANLKEMLEKGSPYRDDRAVWRTLMDFYRAVGMQADFEGLAMNYMSLFSESAPQWQFFDPALIRRQQTGQTSSMGASAYWRAADTLDENNAKTMVTQYGAASAGMARVMDWSNLREITPEGAKIVLEVLKTVDRPNILVQIAAMSNVMAILASKTKAVGSQGDETLWKLRLELLRLFDTSEEFDMEAMEYCLAHEVSPPAWIEPKCKTEDLDAIEDVEDDGDSVGMGGQSTMIGDFSTEFYGQNVKAPLRLRGAIKGSMSKDLKNIDSKITDEGGYLSINCERLVRLDFSAAGDFLNWISEKNAKGYSVQLVKVHRLLALFFIVMGISVPARISLRRD